MGDLKPCPFCGSTDLRLNEFEQYGICNSCNAFGPSFDIVDERDAIAAWNRRATTPEVTALVEALRPFAEAADIKLCGDWRADESIQRTDVAFHVKFGDLRAARAALAAWEAAQK